MSKKRYAVIFTEQGTEQLAPIFGQWLHSNHFGQYVNCKSIDPNGPYFLMKLPVQLDGTSDDTMEFQIPHGFIKCIIYAEDVKQIGFS